MHCQAECLGIVKLLDGCNVCTNYRHSGFRVCSALYQVKLGF